MTRNCVEGDWAITLKTGKIVRCIRWIGKIPGWKGSDRWEIDKPNRCVKAGMTDGIRHEVGEETYSVRDAALTPLRGTFEEIIAQATAIRLGKK